ncbi:MAG: radical SAM protein [Nitrospira sp.]|nr:radical SAM protein [Nitrospira sp.]
MRINEIFYSIQGESTRAGHPCIFVRLTGCNLRCIWCDTAYAFYEGEEMTVDEVLDRVKDYPCRLVEVTGGEPLLQQDVHPLITRLLDRGYQVLIETAGSLDIREVDSRANIIMDIKCPASEMMDRMRWENIESLTPKDEVKFVIKDYHDFEWACQITQQYGLISRCPVLFSPVFGELEPRRLAQWILEDGLKVHLQIQLHKYIWDPQMRGV